MLLASAGSADPLTQAFLLESLNCLGCLESGFGEVESALEHLTRALDLYAQQDLGTLGTLSLAETQQQPDGLARSLARSHHCFTHYYLAQVYAAQGEGGKAAAACLATLQLQLETGQWSADDWTRNCLGMADYCMVEGLRRCGQLLLECCDAFVPWAAHQGQQVDEDLQAHVSAAWGRLATAILREAAAGHRRDIGGDEDEETSASSSSGVGGGASNDGEEEEEEGVPLLAAARCIAALLGLEPSASLPRPRELASFEAAREVFSLGLRRFQSALGRFQLDGWVTDHLSLQLEVSALWRWLQEFEPDLHRRCVMHKRRTSLLEPLLQGINTR